jgi:STE24 endopeptidase
MLRCIARFILLAVLGTGLAFADVPVRRDLPPGLEIPEAAIPGPGFDADRATEAWLAKLTPEQRASSDAYFEGGYWLRLWSLVYGLGVMALLLFTGATRRMRDLAERLLRRPLLSVALFAAMFIVAFAVLELPLSVYAGFVREHQYGLSNLSFGGWLRERAIGLAVGVPVGALVLTLIYAGLRRAGAGWWKPATGFAFVFIAFTAILHPVAVAPLFNRYQPLPEGPVRDAVLSLARANAVPTSKVEWFDASRQTNRISANVAGLGGFARINLNDNLLERTSLPEIRAVLGHEIGHYVLNHPLRHTVAFTLLYGVAFAAVAKVMDAVLARRGAQLRLRDRADPAGLPLLAAIFSLVWFLLTPLLNTVIRTAEEEADNYGLNAAREPQAFAMAAMRLSAYRKLKPGPVEEFLFYDHPSGYDRVRRSMLWLKENPAAGAVSAH